MDSSNSHYSQKLADSLTLVKDKQQLYEDSIQNVINDLQHLLDVANKLKMNLVNRDSFLDLKTAEAKNVYDSFCNSKSSKVRKVIKQHDWLSSIRNLDMGVIYPFLSASTINGIPLKGLNVTTQRKWVEIQVTGGRTMSDYSFFSNSQGNLFDRNTVGVKTGFQLIDRGQIYVVSSTLWDAVKKTQNESGLNSVNGFGWTYQPNSKISITGEALSSFTHSSEVASGRSELTGLGSLLDRTLFLGEIKYVITPASQVQIKYDRRSIGFQSWGSPFMLTNLREIQIKWKQFLWRKQIAILGSFKNLRRNPGSIENKSSSLRGFGFHVNTNFRRYPNIQFMHLPYQQGNNHADTLFRTNNRLSTTIFNVTHTYTAKTFRTTWVGYYTNSQVEYFQLENEILKTSIVSFTQRIEFARSSVELSMMRSHVLPEVDSVQFTGLSFRSNYKLRGLTLLCSANYRHTKSNSQMLRASMGVEKNTYNGLRIGLELGVFYYNGLWGFIDDWSQFGRMTVAYTINKGPKIIKGH